MEGFTQELTSREIVARGFYHFRKNFARIAIPLFFGAILTSITRLAFTYRLAPLNAQFDAFNTTGINSTNLPQFLTVAQQLFSYAMLEYLTLWIIAAPFFGLAIKIAYEALTGKNAKVSTEFSLWLRKIPSLVIASMIVGIIVFTLLLSIFVLSITLNFGFLILVIPAIIFVIMSIMFLPAVILENTTSLGSIRRSRKLVSKRWGKVFIIALIGLVMNLLIGTIFSGIFFFLNAYQSSAVEPFYSLISDVLGVSFLTILYKSLLIKEGGESVGSQVPLSTTTQVAARESYNG